MTGEKETKNKGGRPAKLDKRCNRIMVRFNKSEYYIIRHNAKKSGLKVANYLREAGIKTAITARFTKEEVVLLLRLSGMANNINQMAKAANAGELHSTAMLFRSCYDEMNTLIKQLKDDK